MTRPGTIGGEPRICQIEAESGLRRPGQGWWRRALRALPAGWLLLVPLPAGGRPAAAAGPQATACAAAEAPAGPRLRVTVTDVRTAAGNVTVTLYGPQPDAFLARGGRLARQRIPLRATAAEACFALAAPGDYAVAVYHDENDDHDFNRTLLGLPAEGYGFSNDAPATLGPPDFEAVRFTVPPGGSRLTIHLRY